MEDNVDVENAKFHKGTWESMERISEGKNGMKSEGNTNVSGLSEVVIQYSVGTFFATLCNKAVIGWLWQITLILSLITLNVEVRERRSLLDH